MSLDTYGPRSGPWRVSSNWLIDSDLYNEWLPEEDYEVDELGRKRIHKLRMSVEDLMNPTSDPDRNRWDKCVVRSFFGNLCFFLILFYLFFSFIANQKLIACKTGGLFN